jgi:hypothetical protein
MTVAPAALSELPLGLGMLAAPASQFAPRVHDNPSFV